MALLALIFLGAAHACVDLRSEAEPRTLSEIDPHWFPDTLAYHTYLASVHGSVERADAMPYTGWLIRSALFQQHWFVVLVADTHAVAHKHRNCDGVRAPMLREPVWRHELDFAIPIRMRF